MSTLAKLLLVLTLMPILEISLLIPLHNLLGGWWTLGIVVSTATLGTILIKWQGGAALRRIKEAIGEGRLPGDEILDGVLILVSSIALITPGVITDTLGLLLLVPAFRASVRRYINRRVTRWIQEKTQPAGLGFSDAEPDSSLAGAPAQARPPEASEEGGNIGRPDDIL